MIAVTIDGKPVHLYRFVQGAYEDKRWHLCAHPDKLTSEQIRARILTGTPDLPEEIDFDAPKDLFELALERAGFTILDDVPLGLWVQESFPPAVDRERLRSALKAARLR